MIEVLDIGFAMGEFCGNMFFRSQTIVEYKASATVFGREKLGEEVARS